jgi:hypothetical protein
MHKYRSLSSDFTEAKETYINDQMGLLETVLNESYQNSKFSTVATDDDTNKDFKLALDRLGPHRQEPCPG